MKKIIISKDDLLLMKQEIINEVRECLASHLANNSYNNNEEYLSSKQAQELLGVLTKQWQIMRSLKQNPCSQIDRKIYVKRVDINAYLENHRIYKFKSEIYEDKI